VHEFGVHAIVPATSDQSLPVHETESSIEETNNRR
jgi:hypothetical protein